MWVLKHKINDTVSINLQCWLLTGFLFA